MRITSKKNITSLFSIVVFLALVATSLRVEGQGKCCIANRNATEHACPFDSSTFRFVGTPLEQAKCLLRPVRIRGHLDFPLERLPEPLETLIGRPVSVKREDLGRYLLSHRIDESEIGGRLSELLSPVDSSHPAAGEAAYFVIHDTSSPNYIGVFPPDINRSTWSGNSLSHVNKRITHIYINRVGQSVTVVNFHQALPPKNFGTKFACCLGERRKGLFIHVELIQPRHCDPSHGRCTPQRTGSTIADDLSNDNIAPTPGFSKAQMDRLALIYVAASVRKGEWLIPSFHAPMDASLNNAHDDPQNFDLEDWSASLVSLLSELETRWR